MQYEKINDNFYSKDFWKVNRSRNKWFSEWVKAKIFKKYMKGIERGVLLDAGGGVGNWAWYFMDEFREVYVSDISKVALDKIPEPKIKKLHNSITKHNLPDSYIDCLLLIDVFEHIDKKDLVPMMKDLQRILKKNGKIIIYTTHYGNLFKSDNRLTKLDISEGHLNRLTLNEMGVIFKEAGLKVEDYSFYSVFFRPVMERLIYYATKTISMILKREQKEHGGMGQSLTKDIRHREDNLLIKMALVSLSFISYLDIILFSGLAKGDSIFLKLGK
jgi:ubiquinone/menaquinone biosynthesis C-methylase UbiE